MKKAAKKIVIADDTLPFRVMLEDLLSDAGYEVQTASYGVEAWDILKARPDSIDLLVLDLLMPRMSGFDVLAKIKEEMKDRKFPVLVVSGVFKSDKEITKLKNLGANGYLNKRAVVDELLYRVNSLFCDTARHKNRRHPRVLCNLPVEFQYNGLKHASYTTNLSECGCFIRTLKPAPEGLDLKLWMTVPERFDNLYAECKVAWVNTFDDNRRNNTLPGMGVEFKSLDHKQKDPLVEIVAKKLQEEDLWKTE